MKTKCCPGYKASLPPLLVEFLVRASVTVCFFCRSRTYSSSTEMYQHVHCGTVPNMQGKSRKSGPITMTEEHQQFGVVLLQIGRTTPWYSYHGNWFKFFSEDGIIDECQAGAGLWWPLIPTTRIECRINKVHILKLLIYHSILGSTSHGICHLVAAK